METQSPLIVREVIVLDDHETCETPRRSETKKRVHLEPLETWFKKDSMPEDILPDTPISRKPRKGLFKSKTKCPCETQKVELSWNKATVTVFHSQEKHEAFQSKRQHVKHEDVSLSCSYLAGKHVYINVCYLKEIGLEFDEKVVVVINSGNNEIKLPARQYLHEFIALLDKGFTYYCEGASKQEDNDELAVCQGHAYAEFYTDSSSKWVVLRQYDGNYIAEQIHISAATWIEAKRLTSMIAQNIEYYHMLFIQGHESVFAERESDTDTKDKSNVVRAIQMDS